MADARASAERGLDVRPSAIRGAGLGLFATRAFADGEYICEYRGRVLTLAQVLRMSVEERSYVMGFGVNAHVDGRPDKNMLGRYINDNGNPRRHNVTFVKDRVAKRAAVHATRPIAAGEELYASYGEGYWRARGGARPGMTPDDQRQWQRKEGAGRALVLLPFLVAVLACRRRCHAG